MKIDLITNNLANSAVFNQPMVSSRSHKFSSNDSKRFVNPSFGDGKSLSELARELSQRVLDSLTEFFKSSSSEKIDSKQLAEFAKDTNAALSDFVNAFNDRLN